MTHQTFNHSDFVSRLRAARKAQNLPQKDAAARFAELSGKSHYVYLSYERGERIPPQQAIPILSRMLKVESQFLLYGTKKASKINQLTQEMGENASHNASVRYISIITAQEIEQYLLSQDGTPAMTSNSMPIPQEFGSVLGTKTFVYQIPAGDQSMIGPKCECQIRPGSYLIIDPDQETLPGSIVFVRWSNLSLPMIRQYQGALPLSAEKPFRLVAAHPSIDDLVVTKRERRSCRTIWRAMFAWSIL